MIVLILLLLLLLSLGLQELYLSIMDAVDRSSPGSAVFILQGPQQAPAGAPQWGNGFTGRTGISTQGLSGAGPACQASMAARGL